MVTTLSKKIRMAPRTIKEVVEEVGVPVYIEWTSYGYSRAAVLLGIEDAFPNCYVAENGIHYSQDYVVAFYQSLRNGCLSNQPVQSKMNTEYQCTCPDLLAGHHKGCQWKP